MVLVNSTKYACQSCIKGHRSSSCRHNDRPLFEVQRKGRPVSQCEPCREMREKKRVHNKCSCNGGSSEPMPRGPRHWKYDFDSPDLPNGLKDLGCPSSAPASSSKPSVHDLLNPCECGDDCQCGPGSHVLMAPIVTEKQMVTGLNALAQAAAIIAADDIPKPQPKLVEVTKSKATKRARERSTSPTAPPAKARRNKKISEPTQDHGHTLSSLLDNEDAFPVPQQSMPSFPLPSMHAVTAIAGTGCCCGFDCNCPGCTEHRGAEHAEPGHGDCASGMCATCVDNIAPLAYVSAPALDVPAPSATALGALFAKGPPAMPSLAQPREQSVMPASAPVARSSCCAGKAKLL
jgi:hypothetical protein